MKPNKDVNVFWYGNVYQVSFPFPFPVDYFFYSYSHYWDEIDKCYYYSIFQTLSLLGVWDGYRGEEDVETFSLDLLNYKTELLPV